MTLEEIHKGEEIIKKFIPNFDYQMCIDLVTDDIAIYRLFYETPCNYEKLHFYRIFFENKIDPEDSDIVKKFINESFHIENDYIYQLNPIEYQIVPQYVIDECEKYISIEFTKNIYERFLRIIKNRFCPIPNS